MSPHRSFRSISTFSASALASTLLALACGGGAESKPGDAKAGAKEAKVTETKKITLDTKDGKAGPSLQGKAGTPEEATAFITDVDAKLRALWTKSAEAEWAKATNITPEHEAAAAAAQAEVMAYETKTIGEATRFDGVKAEPDVRRQLDLLKLTSTLPAPDDDAKRKELATIATGLDAAYGAGEWCPESAGTAKPGTEPAPEPGTETAKPAADPKASSEGCLDLGELSAIMSDEAAKPGDARKQLEAWERWRTVSVPMREKYVRFVELGNEGAKAIGFSDVGTLWRSRYDMSPEAFEQEVGRLWGQVQPLYEALHCHVRAKLHEKYGDAVPEDGLIPAHLTGNMWAQDWAALYSWLEPYPGEPSLDVTKALQKAKYDEIKMVKAGEAFFTSLGMNSLPQTFWERSLFRQPEDRKVVCHASAWDVNFDNDLRIKMCIKIDHEDFVTIHHELGHNYYYNNYYTMPVLFQSGAHDGFHEAIGDAIALSITPAYLKEIGLLDEVSSSDKSVINKQMQDALQKVAFLPFGLLVDQWRWGVFAGKTKPESYNADWWTLRAKLQGVGAPSPRGEEFFDPGAKYHVPANTPYMRYFLAHIIQFQFHKAMCEAAGHTGPLHECSIYGNTEAGKKLKAMLAMGASRPWPEAMEALTGTKEMDGAALIEYFGPLKGYLDEQNAGRTCGWAAE
ncbi:M2 family metallopeptidase [Paraliomyxa miuraensis]|uniref:M2 family metallopeptidase n=1 Tax=Paraliomyxa miuraensis TaxID=376150 RepID=UPI00225775EA|nr:M2 family metallopeptidase [Paraliomyxa miuraensis]MCX4241761.1 M2 family metallopeptidase [Paraliomyxa miuraensis]